MYEKLLTEYLKQLYKDNEATANIDDKKIYSEMLKGVITKDTFYNMKKKDDALNLNSAIKMSERLGVSLEEILEIKNDYKFIDPNLEAFSNWEEPESLSSQVRELALKHNLSAKKTKELIADAKFTEKKPLVTFVGDVDSGKSTAINYLLGKEVLKKSQYQTTSAVTYIVSMKDRPDFLKKERATAVIFKGTTIDVSRINDEEYFNEHKLVTGNKQTVIDFCTHNNDDEDIDKFDEPICAVIYTNSKILDACVLVDTPGFTKSSDSKGDNEIAIAAMRQSGYLVYCSINGNFMHASDTFYLSSYIKAYTFSLEKTFILATQAQYVEEGERQNIVNDGVKRLFNALPDNLKKYIEHFHPKNFNSFAYPEKFNNFAYPFSINTEDSKNFATELLKTINPKSQYKEGKANYINEVENTQISSLKRIIEKIEQMIKKIDANLADEDALEGSLNEKLEHVAEYAQNARNKILQATEDTENKLAKAFDDIVNIKHIESYIIENKKPKIERKYGDFEGLANNINNEFNQAATDILKDYVKSLKKILTKFTEDGDDLDFFGQKESSTLYLDQTMQYMLAKNLGKKEGTNLLLEALYSIPNTLLIASMIALVPQLIPVMSEVMSGIVALSKIRKEIFETAVPKRIVKLFNDHKIKEYMLESFREYGDDTLETFDEASKALVEQVKEKAMKQIDTAKDFTSSDKLTQQMLDMKEELENLNAFIDDLKNA